MLKWQAYMAQTITIVGAGNLGACLGKILGGPEQIVRYWDKDQATLAVMEPDLPGLPDLIPPTQIVFLAIPARGMREAALYISPYLNSETIVVSCAKGLEEASGRTMYELLTDVLPKGQPLAILSGPMLATELRAGSFGAAVIGAKNAKVHTTLAELFAGTAIVTENSADPAGVALAGVLKNIYALALGISYGLEWGENARGILTLQAIKEMGEVLRLLSGDDKLVFSPAGIGDLIATGFSANSKNHDTGIDIGRNGRTKLKSEGLVSLAPLVSRLGDHYLTFPIIRALTESIIAEKDVARQFELIITPFLEEVVVMK